MVAVGFVIPSHYCRGLIEASLWIPTSAFAVQAACRVRLLGLRMRCRGVPKWFFLNLLWYSALQSLPSVKASVARGPVEAIINPVPGSS